MDSIISDSFHDSKKMSTSPMRICAPKRRPIETLTVTAFWMTIVSEARRFISSPVCRKGGWLGLKKTKKKKKTLYII